MKKVKKSLALLFAVIFTFSAMSVVASAAVPDVVVTEIGTSSVTVKDLGSDYVFGWKAIGADGNPVYQTSNVIELSGSTVGYEICAKNIQSNETGSAITILAAPAKPNKPTYVSCTATTITMKANSSYQYKAYNTELGFETDWFDENVISGLKKDTVYSVVVRNKTAENQLLGEESEPALIRTAARDKFIGKKEDCRVDISYSGSVEKGQKVKITAVGSFIDAASSDADKTPVEGDIRFVPHEWYAKQTDTGIIFTYGDWHGSGLTVKSATVDTAGVTVKAGDKPVDVSIEVLYIQQEYKNGKWTSIGKYYDSNTFPVNPPATGVQKIMQILTGVINLATKVLLKFFELFYAFLTRKT
ncbi:MAG: hypothetical protein IJK60_05125 [Clostridia bacterium]|nr:hypothetical protein [Clostridia bacterium]